MALNPLQLFLKDRGHIGRANAIGRVEVARRMETSVRDVTQWGRDSRDNCTDGRYFDVVCFSKDGKSGGIFLAANDDEVLAVGLRQKREAFVLLVQLKKLLRALSIKGHQMKLEKNMKIILEATPDEVPEESAEDDEGGEAGEGDGSKDPRPAPGAV
jgi:hypothetical protein